MRRRKQNGFGRFKNQRRYTGYKSIALQTKPDNSICQYGSGLSLKEREEYQVMLDLGYT